MEQGRTLIDKIWDEHVVQRFGPESALLHVDRHFLHDLSGTLGLKELAEHGREVHSPELCFAVSDHTVASTPGRTDESGGLGPQFVRGLRELSQRAGIRLFDLQDPEQGIVHVIGPELGLTLPGTTVVCGDSHTSTHGALGAMAWGIGSTEVEHVLASQTIPARRSKNMRILFEGRLGRGVEAKDLILALIGKLGAAAGSGHAVEYAGQAVRNLSIDERATLCNLSIEWGARMGIVAPDDTTFEYLAGRRYAPRGALWDRAVAKWRSIVTDENASFAREVTLDASEIAPQITWGTSPEQGVDVGGRIPDPAREKDAEKRRSIQEALEYMGLEPGLPIEGLAIDRVFIGSCANSRLSDLRAAARYVRGRKVAASVRAWVVPGSGGVKRAAEDEGLDRVFREAGFEWREPGCSMCVAANGDKVEPGLRCLSTSNRNFVGRQGPGSRTHLASPSTAAASAIAGKVFDVRKWAGGQAPRRAEC